MEDEELERLKERKLQEMMTTAAERIPRSGGPVDLDGPGFDRAISDGNLTLVDFWAEWCGPCKMMHPVFERMARKYRQVTFGRVNVDRNQQVAARFGVQSIPTFIMFKNGREADRMMGAVGEPGIHMIVKKHLGA